MRNDFYVGMYEDQYLAHSFKGTFWKKGHKYLKRIGNVYYYAKKANEFDKSVSKQQDRWTNRQEHLEYLKTRRLRDTYSNMAKNEAQKLFGKKGGEIVSKIMAKVAKPKKKKYKVVNSGYMDGKYLETKAPSNSKIKKHKSQFNSESKKYQIKRANRFGAYYKSSNRND